jgi:hypothetical protein
VAQDVGYAALQIIPSFKGFDRNLERGTSGAMVAAGASSGRRFGESAGRTAGQRFGSVFRTAARVGLVGLGALGVGAFKLGKDAVSQASDLNESLNAVNVTYGKQSRAVRNLGEEAADALGLSNSEFNGLAVQFSAFATQVAGGDGPKVVGVLDDLSRRGADFASVMNLEVSEAMQLFQSGLAGESEPLRKFGVDLSAAKVEAYAYANGIAKQGKELTEAEKVQARYGTLMEQTNKTAGDFANTSDSLANRQRILNARWDNAQAKLGTALLPVMEDVAGFLLKEGIPAFEKASDWFVKDGIPAIRDFTDDMKPLAKELWPLAKDAVEGIRDAAETAAPYVKDLVGFFNDLPSEAKIGGLATALAGYGALKMRGGGSGALGGLGSALGMAKPVPVFVTNPGFGGSTGGGALGGGSKTAAGAKAASTGGKFGNILRGAGALGSTLAAFPLPALGSQVTPAPDPVPIREARDALREMEQQGLLTQESIEAFEDAYGEAWRHISRQTKDMISGSDRFGESIGKLPKEVITKITAPGADISRKKANDLARQYDLTPKEKRTLFRALDIDRSKNSTKDLQKVLAETPKNVNTHLTVSGAGSAKADVDALINSLNTAANFDLTGISRVAASAAGAISGSRNRTKYGD